MLCWNSLPSVRNISFTPSGHSSWLSRYLKVIIVPWICCLFFMPCSHIYLTALCSWANALFFSLIFFLNGSRSVVLLCRFFSIPLLLALPLTCTDLVFCLLPAVVMLRLSSVQDHHAENLFWSTTKLRMLSAYGFVKYILPFQISTALQAHVILARIDVK